MHRRKTFTSPMAKLLITAVVAAAAVWMFKVWEYSPLPDLDPEEWWGPGDSRVPDITVREFKVVFGKEMIEDLKHRLHNFRPPAATIDGAAFQYGFNSGQLDSWKQYWAEKYNFTEREQFLNKYQNYKTNIQGLDIHFIRVKPEAAAAPGVTVIPILLLHGWPGSVREFYELIPYLTTLSPGQELVFEVIAPSLPGFGYSDAPVRSGLGAPQIAVIMRNLMHRLGHQQFYMQAGDWGGEVASYLATLYPDDVLGFHCNLAIVKHPLAVLTTAVAAIFPNWFVDPSLAHRMNRFPWLLRELGYFYIQASKPDTIGAVLSDSPLGLLAHILEKVSVGTNADNVNKPDGSFEAYTKEQLLDNLMLYWAPRSVITSSRLYRDGVRELLNRFQFNIRPTPVLTWIMQAEHEILYQIPSALRYKFPNLVNVTVLHVGGHFIALEAPQVLAKDVFSAAEAFRKIHNKIEYISV